MTDSSTVAATPTRLNARTRKSVAVQVLVAAALAGWMELVGLAPIGWLAWPHDPGVAALALASWAITFAVVWRVMLGRTIEWTVGGGGLRRRGWFSRPGSTPTTVMTFGADAEVVHETRFRWRVWPDGSEIRIWPGQTRTLIEAMGGAGVRIDDFRGDWERGHKPLSNRAVVAYCVAAAFLFGSPIIGIVVGSGPLTPMLVALVAAYVGDRIDRGPWTQSRRPGVPA
jgi:hypothetical protein